jgi:hypothetical protein
VRDEWLWESRDTIGDYSAEDFTFGQIFCQHQFHESSFYSKAHLAICQGKVERATRLEILLRQRRVFGPATEFEDVGKQAFRVQSLDCVFGNHNLKIEL